MYYELAHLYDAIDSTREIVRADLFRLIPIASNKKALDIGCGTGTSSILLKDKGYQVTGVDLSTDMLTIAQQKAPDIEFIQSNILNHFTDDVYDLALCANNIPNHFLSITDLSDFFSKVNNLIQKNGIFIFDIPTLSMIIQLPTDATIDGVQVKNIWSPREESLLQITSKDGKTDANHLKYWRIYNVYNALRNSSWASINIQYGRFSNIFIAKK